MNLKVICLNMWLGGKLFDEIQAFISEEQADILALQEVYQSEEESPKEAWHTIGGLAKILGYPYYAFTPAFSKREAEQRVQMGNAILSRFPIQSSLATFYDRPYNGHLNITEGDYRYTPRNLQHGELLIEDTVLHLFNTQGIWGFDGDDNERRLEMGKIIVREIAAQQPALLMGDFNVQEKSQTIAMIEKHMTNVFKGELTTSFNMQHKPTEKFGAAVVDMMFASPDIHIGQHYPAPKNVSDHLALVAEVEI